MVECWPSLGEARGSANISPLQPYLVILGFMVLGHEEELSRHDIQDLNDLGSDLINEIELDFEPDRNNSELLQVQPLPEAPLRSESRRRFEATLQSFQLLESSSAPSSPVVHSRGAF